MFWLLLFSPFIVLIPIAIYLDKKSGPSNPASDIASQRAKQPRDHREHIFPGDGNGPGPGPGGHL